MEMLPDKIRIERKFTPAGLSLSDVLVLVRNHPALFREAYPPRWVNNLYMDTADLQFYREHVQGAGHRKKVRIRWYGHFAGSIESPALEIKKRHGTCSSKETYPFPAFHLNGKVPSEAISAARDYKPLPGHVRLCLSGLGVVIGNRYCRRYFVSTDGRVRLTVDWDLGHYDCLGPQHLLRAVPQSDGQVIIEIKYNPADADQAASVTGRFPFRPMRCSKYVLGIQRVEGSR